MAAVGRDVIMPGDECQCLGGGKRRRKIIALAEFAAHAAPATRRRPRFPRLPPPLRASGHAPWRRWSAAPLRRHWRRCRCRHGGPGSSCRSSPCRTAGCGTRLRVEAPVPKSSIDSPAPAARRRASMAGAIWRRPPTALSVISRIKRAGRDAAGLSALAEQDSSKPRSRNWRRERLTLTNKGGVEREITLPMGQIAAPRVPARNGPAPRSGRSPRNGR